MQTFAELAHAYHAAGWRIHPVKPRDKRPALPNWPAHCYRDPAAVTGDWRRWPESNLGLVTGPHPDAAHTLVAFDCDGDEFLARALAVLPPTPARTVSGSGKGGHLIYRWPADVPCPPKETLARGANGAHEELAFYGPGGQVVLPGSIHPTTGDRYRWAHAPDDPGAIPPAASLPIIGPGDLAALRPPPAPTTTPSGSDRHRGSVGLPDDHGAALYQACEAHGLSPRTLKAGKVSIVCPWRTGHTDGAQGDSDTAILAADGRLHFKCLHGYCRKHTIVDLCKFVGLPVPSEQPADLPDFPPEGEVGNVRFLVDPLDRDAAVADTLTRNSVDPLQAWEANLAGTMQATFVHGPATIPPPRWARYNRQWWYEAGYRLLLPLWAPDPATADSLREVSVLALQVLTAPDAPPHRTPTGYRNPGAVLATRRDFLADGHGDKLLTVAVGVFRFLQLALRPPSYRGALIGSLPGSATTELLALVPRDWRVLVVAPPDSHGDAAARAWRRQALERGCTFRRIVA